MKRSTNMAISAADHRPSRELGGAKMRRQIGRTTSGSPDGAPDSVFISSLASTNDSRMVLAIGGSPRFHSYRLANGSSYAARRKRAHLTGFSARPAGQASHPENAARRVSRRSCRRPRAVGGGALPAPQRVVGPLLRAERVSLAGRGSRGRSSTAFQNSASVKPLP